MSNEHEPTDETFYGFRYFIGGQSFLAFTIVRSYGNRREAPLLIVDNDQITWDFLGQIIGVLSDENTALRQVSWREPFAIMGTVVEE